MTTSARIQVVVRVRPLSDAEIVGSAEQSMAFTFPSPESCTLSQQSFSFDRVFGPHDEQSMIFNERFKELVDHALDGFNSSIIAYGQTAAGKSYTMSGGKDERTRGIIPRAIARLFANTEDDVQATFVELYNDKFQDLFNNREALTMQGDGAFRNARVVTATTAETLMKSIAHANSIRAVASTNMNSQSSRSHAVLQLRLGPRHGGAKLVLVDLAGSEKAAKTGATGSKLGEAGNINKSLTVLAMVIQALGSRLAHVPYRDSKLTQLLRDSIGGNSKTVLIVNCSPAVTHERESLSSLRFGSRAKLVENKVPDVKELTAISECLSGKEQLQNEIQKWELYGTLPRSQWLDVTEVVLRAGIEVPQVHDPYAAVLAKDTDDNCDHWSEELQRKREVIVRVEKEIEGIDAEAAATDASAQSSQAERMDSTLQIFGLQLKRLTAEIFRCREENAAVLRELAVATTLTPSERSQRYLERTSNLCEQYARVLAGDIIAKGADRSLTKRSRCEDATAIGTGIKARRVS